MLNYIYNVSFSPLEQFEVINYFSLNFVLFNIHINSFCVSLFVVMFFILGLSFMALYKGFVISQSWQLFVESIYKFGINLFVRQVGSLNALQYFPLFFFIFLFVLTSNLCSMLPFGFTVTSHVLLTTFLAFFAFIGITLRGFFFYNIHFLKIYIISGVPHYLLPALVFIEILSYWMRPLSLAIRLFANMLAGHTLLNIIANFAVIFFKKYFFFSFIPLFFIFAVCFLELGVALLQAYVFYNLLLIYLSDSLALHH